MVPITGVKHAGEQEDKTFRLGFLNTREHMCKQWGPQNKECTELQELHWAFQKGFPRRSENKPSRDITSTPVSAGTNSTAHGAPEMGHLGSHLGRWGVGSPPDTPAGYSPDAAAAVWTSAGRGSGPEAVSPRACTR